MKLLTSFWNYWKWLCVALMTTFVVLAVIAALVISFKAEPLDQSPAAQCLERGGTWDAGEGRCKAAA